MPRTIFTNTALVLLSLLTMKANATTSTEATAYALTEDSAPTLHLSRAAPTTHCEALPKSVLYIHGATFSSELSINFTIDGQSWRDQLVANCFTVWALDFAGYGQSERYNAHNRKNFSDPVPGRTAEAAAQITRAVDYILEFENTSSISIIAHSWGTMPAGYFAAKSAKKVEQLVLFGPVAMRDNTPNNTPLSATKFVTTETQQKRFLTETPDDHAPVLALNPFSDWADAYLASDPTSTGRNPQSVEVPNGPGADVIDTWSGTFPYDPADITSPVMIIRGEWDTVTTDADAAWLFSALTNAPTKRDVKIDQAGHLMHFEKKRKNLQAVTAAFLLERKTHD